MADTYDYQFQRGGIYDIGVPGVLSPRPPILPDPEPPAILVVYNYEQLRAYRLHNQPYIVRASYDVVQWMIEDGIMRKQDKDFQEWLDWIERNR